MLLWLFFIGDLLSAIAIAGLHFDFISGWRFPIWCVVYLLAKALMFRDFMSFIDALVAIYMIIMLVFGVAWFVTYLAIAWLAYKLFMTILFR